jgi:hypothetical protein
LGDDCDDSTVVDDVESSVDGLDGRDLSGSLSSEEDAHQSSAGSRAIGNTDDNEGAGVRNGSSSGIDSAGLDNDSSSEEDISAFFVLLLTFVVIMLIGLVVYFPTWMRKRRKSFGF